MLSVILIILSSIFFCGIINIVRSRVSGRKGPGLMQPMKDIFKNLQKAPIYSKTTSFIFRIAPSVYLSSLFIALLLIPFGNQGSVLSFAGDFVVFAYILALGKFFNIISAMDTGSSFEGMGASREALFSMLIEPAFFILMGSLVLLTGNLSFNDIFTVFSNSDIYDNHQEILYALRALVIFLLLMIAMIENSRMPVDDPKTHLELTMVHEVMILDNSGFDLGLIMYSINLKFAIYAALVANLFIFNIPIYYGIPLFILIQIAFATSVGLIESFMARFRMTHNPLFIFALTSVSMLVLFATLLLTGKFI